MIAVSNASPIISLAAVGIVDVLQQLYGQVVIAEAVYNEIVAAGSGSPGFHEVQTLKWIGKQPVVDRAVVSSLLLSLHEGEAETIALGIEAKADLLFIDERKARRVASHFGLKCLGTLGILVEAKQKGLLTEVKIVLDDMMTKSSFRISKDLYAHVLQTVGEATSP